MSDVQSMAAWLHRLAIMWGGVLLLMFGANEAGRMWDRYQRWTVESASVIEWVLIHDVHVQDFPNRSTPLVRINLSTKGALAAGFISSVQNMDRVTLCSGTSGKIGGLSLDASPTGQISIPLSRFVGACNLPAGDRYRLFIQFNVAVGHGVVKPISAQSNLFEVIRR